MSAGRGRRGPGLRIGMPLPPAPNPLADAGAQRNLERSTVITINDDQIEINPDNLETVSQLGRGAYGIVERVRHQPSGHEMAVKRITMNAEQKRQFMDMDVLDKGAECPSIVKYYGAIFWEGDLWIFMEILDASLDRFYKRSFELKGSVPEDVLGHIAYNVIRALNFLYNIKIIHRDIKPSNILINKKGEVKLCDFGIAGHLVNSMAATFEAGCKPYMAPERINPDPNRKGYDIRSDVWSLGITMVEMAIGRFPYESSGNFFQQLKRVCEDEPPRLPNDGRFSNDFQDFIVQCLQKNYENRPNYQTLLEHPFIKQNGDNDVSEFVSQVLATPE